MENPWLDIPLNDYEAHMARPDVGQSALIADQLETQDVRLADIPRLRRA